MSESRCTASAGSSGGRMAPPKTSTPSQPTVHRPNEKRSARVGSRLPQSVAVMQISPWSEGHDGLASSRRPVRNRFVISHNLIVRVAPCGDVWGLLSCARQHTRDGAHTTTLVAEPSQHISDDPEDASMVRSSVFKRLAVVSTMTLVALTAAACGGDDSSTADSGDSGDSGDSSGTDIGVILPDATTSPRWEANDKPSLSAAFDAAGVSYDIQNAQGSVETFGTLCDQMIGEGVKVLMIVNIDQESGKACLDKATDAGVQSIDYDRLTPGGGASYYVSFDNVGVGGLMGTGLISALDEAGKTKANIVYVDGAATDNNAALFKDGYEAALKDKIDSGDYTLVGEQSGEWDATKAGDVFEQMYTDNGGKV